MKKQITLSKVLIQYFWNNKVKMLVVAAALVTSGIQAQVVVPTITSPGAGSWTCPAGVQSVTVECWGAGGAGGSSQLTSTPGNTINNQIRGGGGAGGSYSKVTFTPPVEGTDYNYTVGAGGIAPVTGFTDLAVGDGENTVFGGAIAIAVGGPGGQSKTVVSGIVSGNGGVAPITGNTEGGTNWYGGTGGTGGSNGSGGGGGSAGSLGAGGVGGQSSAGAAGLGGGALGGVIANLHGAGVIGGTPGAGGAGAAIRMNKTGVPTYLAGGAGAPGQIKITYTMLPTGSTVAITAPATKTVVAIGGSVEISATIGLKEGNTFSSIVFKDGTETIPGTITNVGNVYSITYANVPSGKRTITAELTDNTETVISAALIIYGGPVAFSGNKYAQSPITWSAGPWFDESIDGQVVTAPAAGDNVFTQGNAVTISEDATCDNLTFTNVVNQVGIAADKTLTVKGQVSCESQGSFNAFSNSDATGTLKLTGELLSDPFAMVTENAIGGMKPNNVLIEPTNLANTYQWGTSGAGTYYHGTGAFTVAAGTKLTFKNNMYMSEGANFHFVVGDGAVVNAEKLLRGPANLFSRMTKATINGSVIAIDNFIAKELILGTNGSLKTSKSTNTDPAIIAFDGWWGNGNSPTTVANFGTPAVLTFGSSSIVEFGRAGDQNIPGVVTETPSLPGYVTINPIPYANLKLSGSGTKTVRTNVVASGDVTVDVATLLIPTGKVMVVLGSVVNNGIITTDGALINAKSTDIAKGTLSATISATNEVALVATAKPGFQFVNWTEDAPSIPSPSKPSFIPAAEISNSASLPAFTPTDGTYRTIIANFSISTGLSTPNKSNAFVTVQDNTLKLNGDVKAVEVFNAQGKLIQSQNKVKSVNVNGNGIYIVKMHTAQGVNVQKVIVK